MAHRLEDGAESWPSEAPSVENLTAQKSRKGILLTGAQMFNQKPKTGLAFLEKEGIIIPDASIEGSDEEKRATAVAKFLRQSTRLDKKLLGEYISRPDQPALLKAFIGLFDFKGVCPFSTYSFPAYGRNPSPTL